MTIEIINGDLLEAFDKGEVDVIGHVVNCRGAFNAGLAKQIRNKYPEVYNNYKLYCDYSESAEELLGTVLTGEVDPDTFDCPKRIENLFAQLNYGTNKRQLNYGALSSCFYIMSNENISPNTVIGFPFQLGCGLAGGDWSIVLELIEFYFKDYDVKIYKL